MRKRVYKKAASIALALAMAVSVGTAAFAEDAVELATPETVAVQTEENPEIAVQTVENDENAETENAVATQAAGDAQDTVTVTNGATLTLAEFNALTEIPADVTELTVDIGEQTVTTSQNLVIGTRPTYDASNPNDPTGKGGIADYHYHKKLSELTVEDEPHKVGLHNGSTDNMILTTNKPGITLHVKGTVNAESVKNPDVILNNMVQFYVPDKSDIILDGMTINGTTYISANWQQIVAEGYNTESTIPHKVNSITLKDCTINGSIFENGSFPSNLTFDGCTFNKFINSVSNNDSNPIWFKNPGAKNLGWHVAQTSSITIQNCKFYGTRPVKVYEQSVEGVTFKVLNNTFDMSAYAENPANEDGKAKNDALVFAEISGNSGNIEIRGNTLIGVNALTAFNNNDKDVKMADGATFVIKDNVLNGAKVGVVWKSETEYLPDFVEVHQPVKAPEVEVKPGAPEVDDSKLGNMSDEQKKPLTDAAATVASDDITGDAVTNSEAVKNLAAAADIYKDENGNWKETELEQAVAAAAAEGTSIKTAQAKDITLVTVPYLAVTPQKAAGDKQLVFDIELRCALKATTDPDNMTADNTCTLKTEKVGNDEAPAMTIRLDVGTAFTADELKALFIKHESDKGTFYYPTTVNGTVVSFYNPDGFSMFTVLSDARTAVVTMDGTARTLDASGLNRDLPAPSDTANFLGWQFAGVDGTYTKLDSALLDRLAAVYASTGRAVQATPLHTVVPTPTPEATATPAPSATPAPAATPAPTQEPAAAPAATAAPTAKPADTNKYYTCTACGHHNWTATADGYKCDTCGHLETKQLSGYANVKGVYTPKASAAKAATAKATTIPQTSDDMPILPIAIIAVAALLGLCVTAYMRKKN